jgi:peptidoglycan/xylan/chitin deacetylase (PgdA/CDA1 family)
MISLLLFFTNHFVDTIFKPYDLIFLILFFLINKKTMKNLFALILILVLFSCTNSEQVKNSSIEAIEAKNKTSISSSSRRVTPQIPPLVLMYHQIVDTPVYNDDVSTANFTQQMQWLKANGYNFITTEDLFNDAVLPSGSVLLTFDDGYIGNFTNAKPVLENLNLKADFFVHTDYVGTTSTASWDKMSWNQLRTLDSSPLFAVYSHTKTHPQLTQITSTQLQSELAGSRLKLQTELGVTTKRDFLAYPFGDYNAAVITAAQNAGYTMAFAVANKGSFSKPLQYSITRKGVGKDVTTIALFKTRIGR